MPYVIAEHEGFTEISDWLRYTKDNTERPTVLSGTHKDLAKYCSIFTNDKNSTSSFSENLETYSSKFIKIFYNTDTSCTNLRATKLDAIAVLTQVTRKLCPTFCLWKSKLLAEILCISVLKHAIKNHLNSCTIPYFTCINNRRTSHCTSFITDFWNNRPKAKR